MANEKILNTRIQLKYDSLSNWATKNPLLKSGEVAIAYLPPKDPGVAPAAVSEAVLMKVGPGEFNDLPYVSALAADVYTWAKQSESNFVNTFLALKMSDGTTMQAKLDAVFATDDELASAMQTLRDEMPKELGVMSVKASGDTEITMMPTEAADGHVTITAAHTTHAAGSAKTESTPEVSGYGATGTIKVPKIVTNAAGHVTEITEETISIKMPAEQELPTAADYGVLSINAGTGIEITGDDAQNPTIGVKANTYDAHGAADNVKTGVENGTIKAKTAEHADAAGKVDAALTVKVGGADVVYDGSTVKTADVDAAIADAIGKIPAAPVYTITKDQAPGAYAAVYHLTKDGAIVGDAINIPKDMVVEDGAVIVATEEDKALDENVVVGKTYIKLVLQNVGTPLYIAADGLIEYVTSGSTADSQVIINIDENHQVTATIGAGKVGTTEIADKAVTADKLADEVKNAIAKDDNTTYTFANKTGSDFTFTVTPSEGDAYDVTLEANGKADKAVPAAAGNFAGLDVNGNLIDSGKKAADFKTVQQVVTSPETDGLAIEFIDTISQDANGVITATKKKVDLPEDKDTWRSVYVFTDDDNNRYIEERNDLVFYSSNDIKISLEEPGSDKSELSFNIADKAITTAKIADHAIGAHQTKACQDYVGDDAEIWVFNCGNAEI